MDLCSSLCLLAPSIVSRMFLVINLDRLGIIALFTLVYCMLYCQGLLVRSCYRTIYISTKLLPEFLHLIIFMPERLHQ